MSLLYLSSQNFQKTSLFFSSSAAPVTKARKLDEDDTDISRSVTIQQTISPELSKIPQIETNFHDGIIKDEPFAAQQKISKKKDELSWRITPSAELNQLVNHYLMLSKIRLTSELI